jgi:acyl-CoA thioester hydrolase
VTPRVHPVELRVRYAETDRMGVVYHANYLAWCEVGRTEYIRSLGVSYADLESRGLMLAVSDASLRYHAPARYDEIVRIATSLGELRSRTVTFEYLITHAASGTRLVSARTTLVSMDDRGRTVSLPPDVRRLFEAAMT